MTESAHGPSGPGTVVLELGPGIGALVLYTPAELDGREIEISRDAVPGAAPPTRPGAVPLARPGASAGRRTHSQVRPRHMASATRYAAVYPDLAEGAYTIWGDAARPAGRVVITGGKITNWSWPA